MIVGKPSRTGRRNSVWSSLGLRLCAALLLIGGVTGALLMQASGDGTGSGSARRQSAGQIARQFELAPEKFTSDASQLRALSPEDAITRNAAMPLAKGSFDAAHPLSLISASPTDWTRSIECMTAAIYYEAAVEPEEGQRAVAQVILNRVRHPLFPNTVCGVVFQGHERRTGCQFSFTCDGSLARRPVPAIWERARRVAAAALAGGVYAPVGLSTNYHANYVLPYWAGSLLKTATVGTHIFYRLPDAIGGLRSFSAIYAGNEPTEFGSQPETPLLADGTLGEPQVTALAARPIIANQSAPDPVVPGQAVRADRPEGGARWVIGGGPAVVQAEKAPAASPPQAAAPRIVPLSVIEAPAARP